MPYKVWVEIEEVDESGEPVPDSRDLSMGLSGAAAATVDTLERAIELGDLAQVAVRLAEQTQSRGSAADVPA